MRALVTGGAGFIGSYIVDWLIEHGHDVVVLDDLSGGFVENVNSKAEFVRGSITSPHFIEALFATSSFDYVYHIAAYAAEGLSHFIRRFNYTNNLVGSINLINSAVRHNCKCFVFTSSMAVYGTNQLPFREDMIPAPEDPYGVSKYAVELDLKAAHEMFGLHYVIFRPHNVYGDRQNIGDPYRNVIGVFMNQLLRGCSLTVFGDGEQSRAFSHILDVAPIIASSAFNEDAYEEIFNIGADRAYTINQLAEEVQAAMGIYAPSVTHLQPRNEVTHAFSDHSKVRNVFGLRNGGVPLDFGLKQMAAWAKKHGARKGRAFGNIELDKNLPASWRKL